MRVPYATFLLLAAAAAHADTAAPGRGELLYSTHCIQCHTTQMHWRARHVARDWDTLRAQVRQWQGQIGLAWGEDDVNAVAKYLNDSIYHFPHQQAQACGPGVYTPPCSGVRAAAGRVAEMARPNPRT